MKLKILVSMSILLTIMVAHPAIAEPPAQTCRNFYGYVTVTDPTGSPVQGVQVKMFAILGTGIDYDSGTVYGTTNSSGQVTLYQRLCPDGNPITELYMTVSIGNEDFTVLSSSSTSTTLYTVLYPEFEVDHITDGDILDDFFELQLAEKFKPILHTHSWEKQEGLSSAEWILSWKSNLKAYNILGQKVYDSVLSSPADIHDWSDGTWDSFGAGQSWRFWQLDIHNTYRYQESPVGQRPLYYHVYKEGNYYYLQYWIFLGMNDIIDQTFNDSWHEGDFEHVSLKINSSLVPVAVNFYRHEGGRTISPSECWWSSSNNQTYSGVTQGYASSRTHLHIWIAANAHGAYNRYERVYNIIADGPLDICSGLDPENYVDNVDYEPSGHDLYFTYDFLKKMGEYEYSAQAHGYTYIGGHYEPAEQSLAWLTFIGRFGEFWYQGCGVPFPLGTGSDSPLSPAFGGYSHEWTSFTEDYNQAGFGNPSSDGIFADVTISWINDSSSGD
jgi:hypothetical protein